MGFGPPPRETCTAGTVCANSGYVTIVSENLSDGLRPEMDAEPKAQASVPAEFDPPPGARHGWLEGVLGQHAFVVLIFYRGFW